MFTTAKLYGDEVQSVNPPTHSIAKRGGGNSNPIVHVIPPVTDWSGFSGPSSNIAMANKKLGFVYKGGLSTGGDGDSFDIRYMNEFIYYFDKRAVGGENVKIVYPYDIPSKGDRFAFENASSLQPIGSLKLEYMLSEDELERFIEAVHVLRDQGKIPKPGWLWTSNNSSDWPKKLLFDAEFRGDLTDAHIYVSTLCKVASRILSYGLTKADWFDKGQFTIQYDPKFPNKRADDWIAAHKNKGVYPTDIRAVRKWCDSPAPLWTISKDPANKDEYVLDFDDHKAREISEWQLEEYQEMVRHLQHA